eukprot:g18181.t1
MRRVLPGVNIQTALQLVDELWSDVLGAGATRSHVVGAGAAATSTSSHAAVAPPPASAATPGGLSTTSKSISTSCKTGTAELDARCEAAITQSRVMLFMKGSKAQPFCGFSKKAVALLNDLIGAESYATFDILKDEEIRQGLKQYSDWPTYPQLYVDGELQGGLDVMREMAEDGSLLERLSQAPEPEDEESKERERRLRPLVNAFPAMLFMKGSPEQPKCGFSRKAVALLDKLLSSTSPEDEEGSSTRRREREYGTFDILSDEWVRQNLKEWASWPTYPQLWVAGELVGGLDIMQEAVADNSLAELLAENGLPSSRMLKATST